MTKIIDGKQIAQTIKEDLANQVWEMEEKPALAVILVGQDPASKVYVRNKIKACKNTGIRSIERHLPDNASNEDIESTINELNEDSEIDGILLQLPLPKHLDSDRLIQLISPEKDVDGLNLRNVGAYVAGIDGLVPCTPQGSLMLIKSVKQDLSGMDAVVIGRSLLFGKPMAQLLLQENCTVTMAHSRTKNLEQVCKRADIIIAAVGIEKIVKASWIKQGAIVIDVGINRMENGKLCGDVDYEAAIGVAGAITPVPGGVGPMTIACLLANTIKASSFNKDYRPDHDITEPAPAP